MALILCLRGPMPSSSGRVPDPSLLRPLPLSPPLCPPPPRTLVESGSETTAGSELACGLELSSWTRDLYDSSCAGLREVSLSLRRFSRATGREGAAASVSRRGNSVVDGSRRSVGCGEIARMSSMGSNGGEGIDSKLLSWAAHNWMVLVIDCTVVSLLSAVGSIMGSSSEGGGDVFQKRAGLQRCRSGTAGRKPGDSSAVVLRREKRRAWRRTGSTMNEGRYSLIEAR
jgi:hypothetical protein